MLELRTVNLKRNSLHRYTFVEMLVVSAIIALVGALVIPKVMTTSRRMSVESALSTLRGAFNECAMRSRASGKPLQLVLNAEGKEFSVQMCETSLDHDWRPAPLPMKSANAEDGNNENDGIVTGILGGAQSYEVPSDIEWLDLPESSEENGGYVFSFFPDGEACGPQLDFSLKGERYRIVVDSVIGRGTIGVLDE